GLTGIAAEVPFVGKLLSDVGIDLEVEKREQYKTALETFSQPDISPANREMLTSIIGEYGGQLAQGIAQGRGLDQAAVQRLIDGGQAGGGVIGGASADQVAGAIADAVRDDGIKAILLRIDSGGGSAVGSDTIAWQLRRATEAKKPVIVSMGNTAGSGAYWIAS